MLPNGAVHKVWRVWGVEVGKEWREINDSRSHSPCLSFSALQDVLLKASNKALFLSGGLQ